MKIKKNNKNLPIEIDMSEAYLGRYAALQKRNSVAAVLDFMDGEWNSLKALKEADVSNAMDRNTGRLLMESKMIGGKLGEV